MLSLQEKRIYGNSQQAVNAVIPGEETRMIKGVVLEGR
jgi:hypothetical protein